MNRIKELRDYHHWTQEQLGNMIGVQKSAVSKYERGEIPLTDETLLRLATLFNVSVDYLLGQDQRIRSSENSNPLPVERDYSKDEKKYALFGTTNIDDADLQDVEKYVEYVKHRSQQQDPARVQQAARGGGGFESAEGQREEISKLIAEEPKSNKRLP